MVGADNAFAVCKATLGAIVLAAHDHWLRTHWPHAELRLREHPRC
jgi:hypothetical protein